MLMITIYGGGVALVGVNQIKTWKHLYNYVDVIEEIKKLDNSGVFIKMTANNVFKTINKHLEEKNQKIVEIICLQSNSEKM